MFTELVATSLDLLKIFSFGFGIIIGSFLNVVIYRFHTGKSLNGHSHCLSCGVGLRWFDLFPVFSYLWLRGRCRACGCSFSVRYLLVEVLTGVLFVLSVGIVSTLSQLLILWAIMAVMVVILVYDIRHFIIPDALTVLLLGLTVLFTAPLQLTTNNLTTYGIDVLAAFLGALFLFGLCFVSSGRWIGFGDVKLAFPLGLLVSADAVFSLIVSSFWIGALISIALVGLSTLQRGKLTLPFLPSGLTIKSVVPFAPFLIAGCLLVLFTHIDVLTLFTR